MKKAVAIAAVALVATLLIWWAVRPAAPAVPRIPAIFAAALPETCQQVILVLSPQEESVEARLWLLERDPGAKWRHFAGPIPATLGRKGLAWGQGEHQSPAPAGFRSKIEGDKCSPAGVFRIPFAFGLAPADEVAQLKLRYVPLTPSIIGVDDPKSRYYNQVVDNSLVGRDWDSNEAMIRHDRLYQWGAFIGHNPEATPGGGSCIFLHLWPGPGKPTAGCTAMADADLKQVLLWLDPDKDPRMVQGLAGW